ncbi:PD-(D/E)XK nuclease family protein [Streptomyces sp. NPDC093221]|uniref:PD-(D/E)XK nuclease family protein n=1 Tax=Streptomyces sp. NPDC093221 TaxID=3366032 RepID=UPI00381B043A
MPTAPDSTAIPDPSYWAALQAELDVLAVKGLWLPGPATTLEVLGQSEVEIHHERLIAWLLDPLAPHYLGPTVLRALLQRFLAADSPSTDELIGARVRTQAVAASSRPDIVVTMPKHTLVIELKINSPEGEGQTTRQADDHANMPHPVLVFLTRRCQQPTDRRFEPLGLTDFATDLRQCLESAPKPRTPTAAKGRAVAHDYLATLEKMLAMDPADQEAARFWLAHGRNLLQAQAAAKALLAHLPQYVVTALESVSPELGDGLVASSFPSKVVGSAGKEYTEDAVLLARQRWLGADGRALFGMGFGQRTRPNPDIQEECPFWGVYAHDPDVRASLRATWGVADERPWGKWVWWKYLELEPPTDAERLLAHYAGTLAEHVRTTWPWQIQALDSAVGGLVP